MNRCDLIYVFDCKDANPNGDPDADNMPRIDVETNQGLVTDVGQKRKIRSFVHLTQAGKKGREIFIQEKRPLNPLLVEACQSVKLDPKKTNRPRKDLREVQKYLCARYYDIRAFGGVLSIGPNCGQVRGPVQLSFARSIDPVMIQEHCITRVTKVDKEEGEMGRKYTIPYGLYRSHGFINPFFAAQTGFNEDDLDLFFEALVNSFEFDSSTARPPGSMRPQAIIAFKHSSELGEAPSHTLFDSVQIRKKAEVSVPRSFQDYELTLPDQNSLPEGVTLHKIL
jgi:CRISPR-associated protein Csd2